MDEFVDRLQRLPKRPLICQGGYFASPRVVRGGDGLPVTPTLAVWTMATDESVLTTGARFTVGDDLFVKIVELLDAFVTNCMDNQACPNRLQVGDFELAEYLSDRLQGTGIAVELVAQLPQVAAVINELAAQLQLDDEPLDLLKAEGMTSRGCGVLPRRRPPFIVLPSGVTYRKWTSSKLNFPQARTEWRI